MRGPMGVKSTPRLVVQHGTGRSRLRAFPSVVSLGLALLAGWWFTPGSALARSYPPAIGCAVSGAASVGAGVLEVRGMGFRAGSAVLVSVAGSPAGRAVADRAGSFEATWLIGHLTSGATLTAADASCTATSAVSIENQPPQQGDSVLPPVAPGAGSATGKPTPPSPAKPGKARPAPALPAPTARTHPTPPALRGDPVAVAIPSIPVTGLAPQFFLGLAGALLLAGAALTGLTGRLGHRGERRPTAPSTVSSTASSTLPNTLPVTRGNA